MARTNKSKPSEKTRPADKHSEKARPVGWEPESEGEEEVEEVEEDDGYSSPSVLETGDADEADIGSDLDGENDEESSV